jgi:hypothetical protein
MRTLAKWGASLVRDAPFTSVRGQDGKVCSFFTSNYGRGSFERFEAGVEASFIHQRRGTGILRTSPTGGSPKFTQSPSALS